MSRERRRLGVLKTGFRIKNPDEWLRHDGPKVYIDDWRDAFSIGEIILPVIDDPDLGIASVSIRRIGFR